MDHFLPLYQVKKQSINDKYALERMIVREPNVYIKLIAQHRELCDLLRDHLKKAHRLTEMEQAMMGVEHMEACETFEVWKKLVAQIKSMRG